MSLWTRDKVFLSADKSTYLQWDSGLLRLNIVVSGTVVGYMTTTGVVWNVGETQSSNETFSGDTTLGDSAADALAINATMSTTLKLFVGTLAALGTNQGTAAAITKQVTIVTGATNATGVILPTGVAGMALTVINSDATHYLPVYPDTGGAINGGSANAAVNLFPGGQAEFICTAALTWYCVSSGLYVANRDVANLVHTGGMPARVSTDGTEKTTVVTETYIAQIHIPRPMLVTGIAVMNGASPAGSYVLALADDTGAVVANTALAGTAASGGDAYQRIGFTAAYFARPGTYYVLLQCNSASGVFNGHIFGDFRTGKKTGEVFGTLTTITPPTTFTTILGPIASLYT